MKLFGKRIDAYFYMYRRIVEYLHLLKDKNNKIQEFEKELYQQLISIFWGSNGSEPNLCVENEESLKQIGLRGHIDKITEIKDIETLYLYFVLCKLTFQASLIGNENSPLK
jgi:hypothetical protein